MIKVLDFYADWCGPCKVMSPVFEALKKEYAGKAEFESIDVEANGAMAGQYQVMSIPTFIILKDGKEVSRRMGAMPKDTFKTWLEENI
ncbi:thioredoxin [Patescibacteria group bacterium]|nr:thioredoxin [Patescibacteria group bacterium]HOM78157.1 thioredoxin [bacterium]